MSRFGKVFNKQVQKSAETAMTDQSIPRIVQTTLVRSLP